MKRKISEEVRKFDFDIQKRKFKRQEDLILELMLGNPSLEYSSEDIQELFEIENNQTPYEFRIYMLMTSVRRALCNLHKKGLIFPSSKAKGSYNCLITKYKVASQFKFF